MNQPNSRYSTAIPDRETMADMLMFYAMPETRRSIWTLWPEETDLLDQMVEDLVLLAAEWEPTEEWHHRKLLGQNRVLEWMAWRVAMSYHWMGEHFAEGSATPWEIDVRTLPRYGGTPTRIVTQEELEFNQE